MSPIFKLFFANPDGMSALAKTADLLRLNVGFIAHQPVGYSREFVFEYPEIQLSTDLTLSDFTVKAVFSRNYQGLLAEVDIQAETELECVRCLTTIQHRLQASFTELFAFSARAATESGLILPENGRIDLGPLVREYLILEIPISPICMPDCQGLCPVCGENRNTNECQHDIDEIDPRLANLNTLIND
jgi:uncharacterized protein